MNPQDLLIIILSVTQRPPLAMRYAGRAADRVAKFLNLDWPKRPLQRQAHEKLLQLVQLVLLQIFM